MPGLAASLPAVDGFPTVDEMADFVRELAERHPDRVQLREVGRSRAGDPIQLLSLRTPGAHGRAFVIGQPHPNEPIGMATITALCEWLLTEPGALESTGVDWHFVPVADPDGTRLNEGWFRGPWTREHYARHFYRPASDLQVEWTFPFRTEGFEVDAPLPETRALMAAIDEVKPTVLASLHNGEMGGGYFYVNPGESSDYYHRLSGLCHAHGIPLHLGDPETPFSELLAPAVFSVPTAQQVFDFITSVGADPADVVTGANSAEYAERHGPVTGLAIELPYWRDERSEDTSPDPSGRTLREVTLAGLDLQEQLNVRMRELMARAPLPPSPFADAVEGFAGTLADGYLEGQRHEAAANPDGDRPATVAEVFSIMDNVHMFRLRLGGMLLRALPEGTPAHAEAEASFSEWSAEAAADNKAEPIAIRDLVAVQAEAILAAVEQSLTRD